MKKYLMLILLLCGVAFTSCDRDEKRAAILKVYNWADYIDQTLLDEFEVWYEEQTGEKVEVVYQLFDINEIMLAKIERGKEDFDLACPSEYIIERMLRNDLILPIDKSIIPDSINYFGCVSPYITNVFDKIDGDISKRSDLIAKTDEYSSDFVGEGPELDKLKEELKDLEETHKQRMQLINTLKGMHNRPWVMNLLSKYEKDDDPEISRNAAEAKQQVAENTAADAQMRKKYQTRGQE